MDTQSKSTFDRSSLLVTRDSRRGERESKGGERREGERLVDRQLDRISVKSRSEVLPDKCEAVVMCRESE